MSSETTYVGPHGQNLLDDQRRTVAREAIATADAHLTNVGLPGYLEVVGALQRLVLSLPTDCQTEAREEAQGVLAQLRGRL
jgi:hypothetical protein